MVYETFLLGVGKLCLQCLYRCGLWATVGHVHYRGDTSSCSCSALGVHVGLVCQSGVAEVHMVVDTSRYEVLSAGIDDVVGSDTFGIGATDDSGYSIVFDEYATYVLFAFVDDSGLVN